MRCVPDGPAIVEIIREHHARWKKSQAEPR
jgi:hypothetical protein